MDGYPAGMGEIPVDRVDRARRERLERAMISRRCNTPKAFTVSVERRICWHAPSGGSGSVSGRIGASLPFDAVKEWTGGTAQSGGVRGKDPGTLLRDPTYIRRDSRRPGPR